MSSALALRNNYRKLTKLVVLIARDDFIRWKGENYTLKEFKEESCYSRLMDCCNERGIELIVDDYGPFFPPFLSLNI